MNKLQIFEKVSSLWRQLGTRFFLLVLIVLAPIAAFDAYHTIDHYHLQLRIVQSELERTAGLIAKEHVFFINSAHEILTALAQIPELRGDDIAACTATLEKIGPQFAQYTNFSKVDRNGFIVCSSTPLARPIDASRGINIVTAFRDKTFSLSEYRIGRISGKPVIVFSEPIIEADGSVSGTVNNGLSLDWFEGYLSELLIPPQARVTLFDGTGIIYAADGYPENEARLGHSIHGSALHVAVTADPAITFAEYVDRAGDDRLVAYRLIPFIPGRLFVAVDMSKEMALGKLLHETWTRVFVYLLVLAIGLFLGRLHFQLNVGRWVTRLVGMAHDIAHGNYSSRSAIAYDQGELGELALAMDSMAERIAAQNLNLHQAIHEAERSNHSKTVFLSNMNHELRTPLNSINGFSEMMTMQVLGELPEAYLEYAENIHASGSHLLEIINDILDMAKIEAGEISLNEENVDVSQLIGRTITMTGPIAKSKGISVHASSDETVVVRCDRLRLKQALLNLLSNAIKFSDGKPVTVTVRRGDDIVIEVRDHGIGISEENLKFVTDPFSQVEDRAFSRRFQGTGLGLAITKKLVELHGGRLIIESRLGQGTAVSIHLPGWRLIGTEPA